VIIATALLVGSLLMATFGHWPLLVLLRSDCDPRVSIVAWLVGLGSVFATSIGGVVLLGLPGHGGVAELLETLHSCWSTLHHGAVPELERALAVVGALTVGVIVGRLGWVAARQNSVRRTRRERYRFLMTVADSNRVAGTNVVWLDHPVPVAFSLAGRPGVVAVSRGARDLLRPVALAAALEHEQAHLRGRHHLLLDVVDAAAAAVSVAPLFREAPRAMRELVELAADEAAVHRCGSAAVADALRVLSAAPPAAEGIAMANRAVRGRLAHLSAAPAHRAAAGRTLVCSAAALVMALSPGMLGLVLWAAVACSVG